MHVRAIVFSKNFPGLYLEPPLNKGRERGGLGKGMGRGGEWKGKTGRGIRKGRGGNRGLALMMPLMSNVCCRGYK
jgi:hypothetical protein